MRKNTWLVLRDESLDPKNILAAQEDTPKDRLLLIRYRKQLLRERKVSQQSNLKIIREQKPALNIFQKMMATLSLVEDKGILMNRISQTPIMRVFPREVDHDLGLTNMMVSTAIESISYLIETKSGKFDDEEQEVILRASIKVLKDMKVEVC